MSVVECGCEDPSPQWFAGGLALRHAVRPLDSRTRLSGEEKKGGREREKGRRILEFEEVA